MEKTAFSFTEARIRSITSPPAGAKIRYHDTECPGLCLRATSGSKTFIFYGKDKGRPVELRIGPWPTWTVETARRKAKEIALDPAKEATARRAIREESTVAELWDWFRRTHVAQLRPSTQARYSRSWQRSLAPHLGNKRLSEVRKSDLRDLVGVIAQDAGQAEARHAMAVLRAAFRAASKDDSVSCPRDLPTFGVKATPVASRERFLGADEMPRFLSALDVEPPLWRTFWRCCLLVGLRRGNVASARWEDVDLSAGLWHVPGERSKNGDPLRIPIPEPATAVLRQWKAELPQLVTKAAEAREALKQRGDAATRTRLPLLSKADIDEAATYLFPAVLIPGRPPSRPHIVEPKASFARVLRRAGLKNLRPHDLRRTLGSWMAIAGESLSIIGAQLGHRSSQSTQVYARLNDTAVRAATDRATAAMINTVPMPSHSDTKDAT